jgi:molybdopterin/thiamine biosynthesis adenylyltransferase
MLTEHENILLRTFHVAVIGCGGLGGYVIEMLARLGIGTLSLFDGDVFDRTNLNRQLLSNETNMGQSKAHAAKKRIHLINRDVSIRAYDSFLNHGNHHLLEDCDLVIDAVDSVDAKLMLQDICHTLEKPLVFGAIAGWYGQVASIFPGDWTLNKVYRSRKSIEKELGNPAFTPATIASIQVAEAIKILLGKEGVLRQQLLFVDLLSHDYELVEF